MKPIDPQDRIEIDRRDWDSLRDRVIHLEENNRMLFRTMGLLQQGIKERFDEQRLLLSRLESAVERKDLG